MTSLPGSPRLKREATAATSALNTRGLATYDPVTAVHKTKPTFTCPAVRVRSLDTREPTAIFPLSREELGEVWTTRDEFLQ